MQIFESLNNGVIHTNTLVFLYLKVPSIWEYGTYPGVAPGFQKYICQYNNKGVSAPSIMKNFKYTELK